MIQIPVPAALGLAAVLTLLSAAAHAADLQPCDTSIAGQTQSFVYDPDSPTLKDSLSLRERLYGERGAITCPGLVTLRVMTPEMTDAERAPFCLQWDAQGKTYIGYDIGSRDAWLTCRKPSRSFCERVNRSKTAAGRLAGQTADFALGMGTQAVLHPSGAVAVQGPAAVIGEKLVALGSTALSGVSAPAALGAVAVTAVAVGGAVYICSDSGAEAAAVAAAPVAAPAAGLPISGLPAEEVPGSDLPEGVPPASLPEPAPIPQPGVPAQPQAPAQPD